MTGKSNSRTCPRGEDRYRGFSLKSVCWGYREIFVQAIEGLFEEGLIGPDRREVTGKFFELMKQADRNCFDHVLKQFLAALNPRTRWLMDLPVIFVDIVDLGREFAQSKLHYGIRFFETLGRGGFGDSPEQVRNLLTYLRRLRQIDEDLALAFLKGYRRLIERLEPAELELYLQAGLQVFERRKRSGLAFMEGTLRTSETYICSITRECRLGDVQPLLASMLKALVGYEVEICELSMLDSDELLERGSSVVCMYKWLYLPQRIRRFDENAQNRNWYLLTGVVAAGMLVENSFCRIHGRPGYETCRDLVGDDPLRLALFQILEYVRVLRNVPRRWPGAGRLLDFGIRTEFEHCPPGNPAERLFRDAMAGHEAKGSAAGLLCRQADASVGLFDTASRLDGDWIEAVRDAYPGLDGCTLRPLSFLPDFLYPGRPRPAPKDALVADLKQKAPGRRTPEEAGTDGDTSSTSVVAPGTGQAAEEREKQPDAIQTCCVYDEWSQEEDDYYRDYCFVHEQTRPAAGSRSMPGDIMAEARRVSRIFERFRPELARREKFLPEGDVTNADLLLEYLVQRRKEPAPRINFYEKPRINQRDLAVLILLDTSGSTGQKVGGHKKVIDIEKHAALILGQGLACLGDRFSICGFSSNGRENCSYFVYKDFDEQWGREAVAKVLSAYPSNSTRMGPALRHSGHRLGRIEARQRLIILVTDGKPLDNDYDPTTRYAQHDVRMACEENVRQDIHTFGISTEENSLADMEIMFPRRRFVILGDIRQLPHLLPKLYIKLTV